MSAGEALFLSDRRAVLRRCVGSVVIPTWLFKLLLLMMLIVFLRFRREWYNFSLFEKNLFWVSGATKVHKPSTLILHVLPGVVIFTVNVFYKNIAIY